MGQLSRRSFLKRAVTFGAGAATTSLMGCAPQTAHEAEGTGGAQGSALSETGAVDSTILEQKWTFEIPPEPIPESEITATKAADVVVVGGGTSGLCCALSAAQSGLDVVLISKADEPVARGGSNFAVYSKYMEEIGAPRWDVESGLRAYLMHNSFNVDTKKWYRFYNNSEESMNWLIDEMAAENDGWHVELEAGGYGMPEDDPMRVYGGTHGWTNGEGAGSGGQPHVVEVLAKHLQEQGSTVDWGTTAVQLIREDNNTGRVTSVIAVDPSGAYVRYDGAKAIVLATGDFSGDRDMMARYCPSGIDMFVNYGSGDGADVKDSVFGGLYGGDGHKMGLWVGAAWQKTYPCPVMYSNNRVRGYSKPQVMLDNTGHRFWAEERVEGIVGIVQSHCPDKTFYHVWSANFADFPYNIESYGGEPTPADATLEGWESAVEKGDVVRADTIEELVEALGLPQEAVAELARYNEFCANGDDEDFHKRLEFLVGLNEPPFYGAKVDGFTALTVLGGLRTNQNMQVCDENDVAIPGLYNVGTMIGDVYANAYTFQVPGNNLGMNCVTFGYLTGKYIAENE